MASVNGFLGGVDDFVGGVLNSNLGQTALQLYQQKLAVEAEEARIKAQAALDAERAKVASEVVTSKPAGSAGPSTQTLLMVGGAVVGLVLVVVLARSASK